MTRDLHPSDGARYLLERVATSETGARYRATIFTPGEAFAADAALAEDGSVELGATGAPAELHARLATITRVIARDAAKLRADGMPPWPQRVLKWRK